MTGGTNSLWLLSLFSYILLLSFLMINVMVASLSPHIELSLNKGHTVTHIRNHLFLFLLFLALEMLWKVAVFSTCSVALTWKVFCFSSLCIPCNRGCPSGKWSPDKPVQRHLSSWITCRSGGAFFHIFWRKGAHSRKCQRGRKHSLWKWALFWYWWSLEVEVFL